MITNEQINEIKQYLRNSENPLIFFDDDTDGLSAYLLLRRYMNKGKGVILKTAPILNLENIRKVKENNPDLIIVLDIAIVEQEFIDSVNVPIIWLDHHPALKRENVHYYNPRVNDENDARCTTYWCYKITNKDFWIAMVGIVSDWYLPEFKDRFAEEYPELLDKDVKDVGKAYFDSRLGELIKVFYFLLKGKSNDVNKNIAVLNRVENPNEILEQTTSRGKFLFNYAEKIKKYYDVMLKEALDKKTKGKLYVYIYSNRKHSFTNMLSTELSYRLDNEVIILGRQTGDRVKFSIRSKRINIQKILEKALVDADGYGGGHEKACGGNVSVDSFSKLVEVFRRSI